MIQTNVDDYLRDGCGRCDQFKTPTCKVHLWTDELVALRALVRASGLDETVKWGSPCYTLGGKNVAMIVSYRDHCALQFWKGAALVDEEGVLVAPGESSRFVRLVPFRSMAEVKAKRAVAKRLLEQAIALEREGKQVDAKPAAEPVPAELAERLAADPALARAFEARTPGRRRSHILHVSGAKQSETRARRVDKCAPEILAGRGFNER
jgi:uncharacterized protein YdeI (YjbR/CyaY-like superfamily)